MNLDDVRTGLCTTTSDHRIDQRELKENEKDAMADGTYLARFLRGHSLKFKLVSRLQLVWRCRDDQALTGDEV